MITKVVIKVFTHDNKILEYATTPQKIETFKGNLLNVIYANLIEKERCDSEVAIDV